MKMDRFDRLIVEYAQNVDAADKPSSKPHTYLFDVDVDGWLPPGQYLVTTAGAMCRVAYRRQVWDSWSPPHFMQASD
jgi:hypothetical protein